MLQDHKSAIKISHRQNGSFVEIMSARDHFSVATFLLCQQSLRCHTVIVSLAPNHSQLQMRDQKVSYLNLSLVDELKHMLELLHPHLWWHHHHGVLARVLREHNLKVGR